MTAIELHRMAMDTQDHIERMATMWFDYLKFAIPCLVCYCLGWSVAIGFPFNNRERSRT